MRGFKAFVKKNFLTGLLFTVPAALTFFLLSFAVSGTDRALAPLVIRLAGAVGIVLPERFGVPGLGFAVIFLLIFLVGLGATNFLGKKLVAAGDLLVNQIPFVRTIYVSIKKIVTTISQTKTLSFQQVVLLDYPRPGLKGIGIVSCDTGGEIAHRLQENMVSVFVPTTPNPTTGFLVMLPRERVIPLDIPVNDGLKMIVSVGMFNPSVAEKPANDIPG
ncbi:MAG: DUF502 domain-containing protein [Nitrospinales bacterium]